MVSSSDLQEEKFACWRKFLIREVAGLCEGIASCFSHFVFFVLGCAVWGQGVTVC
jgi:phage shock protein PspC (stress-responsive transcriptional regulator)